MRIFYTYLRLKKKSPQLPSAYCLRYMPDLFPWHRLVATVQKRVHRTEQPWIFYLILDFFWRDQKKGRGIVL
jgi:hypothetical protein